MKVHTLCDGIRRFGNLSLVNQVLAIETVLALLLARMITGFVPARYWLRWLHTEAEPEMRDVPYTPGCKEVDQPPSIVGLQTEMMDRGQPAPNVVKAQSGSFDLALPPRLGRAVAKVARYLPINARCLQQAMATQWILKRRGVHSILVLGVRRNINANHDFQYHAWLTVDGRPVIGGEEAESYKTFPTFSLRKKNVRKVARTLSE